MRTFLFPPPHRSMSVRSHQVLYPAFPSSEFPVLINHYCGPKRRCKVPFTRIHSNLATSPIAPQAPRTILPVQKVWGLFPFGSPSPFAVAGGLFFGHLCCPRVAAPGLEGDFVKHVISESRACTCPCGNDYCSFFCFQYDPLIVVFGSHDLLIPSLHPIFAFP